MNIVKYGHITIYYVNRFLMIQKCTVLQKNSTVLTSVIRFY